MKEWKLKEQILGAEKRGQKFGVLKSKIIVIMLLICVSLTGCDIRNYVYTEESLKRVAEKSLKDKYGEEFVIYRTWDRSQEMFFAECSPMDDREVVFETSIKKNGDGVVEDGYAQAGLSNQIHRMISADIEETFPDCYSRVCFVRFQKIPTFENAKTVTLEEFMSVADIKYVRCAIYVNISRMNENGCDDEYKLFAEKIQKLVEEGVIPDLSIHIFFVDDEMKKACEDYYTTRVYARGEFAQKLMQCKRIVFRYENSVLDMTYKQEIRGFS